MDLRSAYGWDDEWERTRASCTVAGVTGRVLRVDRGECDVITANGVERVMSDSVRAQADLAPAAGDWVVLGDGDGAGPVIAAVLARRTEIVRRDPAEAEVSQILVANADLAAVVCGRDRPFSVGRIERFLVMAEDGGANGLVIATKLDTEAPDTSWDHAAEDLGSIPLVMTSAQTGDGIDEVRHMIGGHRTLALLGESGAGKSTLVNALVAEDRQETGAVRSGDRKGRHTTRARELVLVPSGGVVIDTPGIRSVGLWDARDGLERVFADIASLAAGCRFADCRHGSEPGCGVAAAVAAGSLDRGRFERYHAFSDELDVQDARRVDQQRATRGRRRR